MSHMSDIHARTADERADAAELRCRELQATIDRQSEKAAEHAKLWESVMEILWWGADDRPDGRWPCGTDYIDALTQLVERIEGDNLRLSAERSAMQATIDQIARAISGVNADSLDKVSLILAQWRQDTRTEVMGQVLEGAMECVAGTGRAITQVRSILSESGDNPADYAG